MKHFLYLRGHPGVGKITVAKELEKLLGWKLFWFHDLKNAVVTIVKQDRIPRLMDELTAPVIRFLLEKQDDIIYVRPSPDKETVENIAAVVKAHPNYKLQVIRLEAGYDTLLSRVSERNDPFRIAHKTDLDTYLTTRSVADIEGEHIIQTDDLTPAEVARRIKKLVAPNKKSSDNEQKTV